MAAVAVCCNGEGDGMKYLLLFLAHMTFSAFFGYFVILAANMLSK